MERISLKDGSGAELCSILLEGVPSTTFLRMEGETMPLGQNGVVDRETVAS